MKKEDPMEPDHLGHPLWHPVFISIGSNMGDRLRFCRQAIARVSAHEKIRSITASPFYETEPVDYTDQGWFINAVFKIETTLSPLRLLDELKSVQAEAGRMESAVRFGPRVLDLDILLYDDLIMDTPELTIPHPRMHKRRFVLLPMCDIGPNVLHPIFHCPVKQLLANLDPENQTVRRIDV